jgi:hypothetical protein
VTKAEIDALLQIAGWLGWALVGLLAFLGVRMYNDVRDMKENWVSKTDLQNELAKVRAEQAGRHTSNGRKFERVNTTLGELVQTTSDTAVMVERRIGEVRELVASLRPPPPAGQTERRRGFTPSEG